jgi:hypothetical protein
MLQLTQFIEKAVRPGVLGLPGRLLEKRCQRDLRAYFITLEGQVLAADLGSLANQPAPQARHIVEMKLSNILRVNSVALRLVLETNLIHAFNVASGQEVITEAYSDDEDRDETGKWTSGGTHSKLGTVAAVGVLAALGLSGAKSLIGTPYSVLTCSQFACALTGHKKMMAPELYAEGKPGKIEDAKNGDIVAFNGSHVAVMTKDGLMDSIPERGVGFVDWSKVSPADPWYKGPIHIIKGKPLGNVKEADEPQPSARPLDDLGITGHDAVTYAEQRAAELVTGINETTLERIADAVAEGIENRLGVPGTSKLIREVMDDMSKFRADMIATTEINSAMSEASLRKIASVGIPYKRWLIADDDADEICTGNADQGAIPVGEAFDSGDFRPPAHPNCRCAVVGARAPEQESFQEYSDDEPRDERGRWSASDSIKVSNKAFETKFGYGTFDKIGKMEVPVKDIVITQEYITQKGIDKYRGKKVSAPILVKRGSKFYVADGHHRIAAAVADGKKVITADVLKYRS